MQISIANAIQVARRIGSAASIITDGLKMWLGFKTSEISGDNQITPDKSGNNNVGELFTGKALEFDGSTDSVDIDGFQLAGSDATFAFWINPDFTTGSRPIFDVNPTRLRFRISSGNLEVLSGSTVTFGSIASDQWQRVVIVINGTSADAYINGVQSGVTQTITAIDISTATLARIAANYIGVGTLDGKLSDFQIYNAVWSASDIAYDYAKPNHLVTDNPNTSLTVTNLKGYWALSEGSGSAAYDSSGAGNNGTINGADYVVSQQRIPQLGMVDWAKGSNLFLNSEPTSNEGVAGNITYGSYSWGLNGFSNATIYGDSSVTRYRYGATALQNTEYTLSCYVIMDDLTEPSIGNNTASGDFSITIGGGQATLNTTSVNVSGNVWRISRTITTGTTNLTRNGIVKYTSQSDKGFKVVGWQLEQSATVGNYILTDGAAAIDVTTIENPANKGYDILGNPLRLREHSFNLDGSGYAEVADDDSLDVNEGFSVSFWRKLDVSTDGVRSALVTKGVGLSTAVDNGVALSMNNNSIVGDVNTNVGRTFIQKPLTINGSWVFVTFTYTKNEKSRLYIDTDAPIVSTTISGTINETHPIMIGTDKNLGFKDSALIDEVVWYDRPLSENEILNNYNVGLPTHSNSSSFSSDFGSDFGG